MFPLFHRFGLELLCQAEIWSADGTFSVAPAPFYQLYTIMAHLDSYAYPAAFVFLPGKKNYMYRDMLAEVKTSMESINNGQPLKVRRFLIDFELSVMKEIRLVFGRDVQIAGCFVHFRRNLRKNLQKQKYLQSLAGSNNRFYVFLCGLVGLVYVPIDEVAAYYKALIDEELPEVLDDIRQKCGQGNDDDFTEFDESKSPSTTT
jgi:hypothetical protein